MLQAGYHGPLLPGRASTPLSVNDLEAMRFADPPPGRGTY